MTNREDILWLLKHTLNTFECLRDDNTKANVKYKDAYFKGKVHAYDLAVQNLHNVINVINEEGELAMNGTRSYLVQYNTELFEPNTNEVTA